jgi:hypothetical protein
MKQDVPQAGTKIAADAISRYGHVDLARGTSLRCSPAIQREGNWPTDEGRRGTAEGASEFGRGESAAAVFTAVVTGVRTNRLTPR